MKNFRETVVKFRGIIEEGRGIIEEETGAGRLKAYATVKMNYKDADFWITRRGTPDEIGRPSKEFNKESFGVKVFATDILDPQFLYYAMMNIHGQGLYKNMGTGTTQLVSIKLNNIKNIRVGPR